MKSQQTVTYGRAAELLTITICCGSYLCTMRKAGQFQLRVTAKPHWNCINLRLVKGDMDTLSDTVGRR